MLNIPINILIANNSIIPGRVASHKGALNLVYKS
jgi:hypothetical protein